MLEPLRSDRGNIISSFLHVPHIPAMRRLQPVHCKLISSWGSQSGRDAKVSVPITVRATTPGESIVMTYGLVGSEILNSWAYANV